MRKPKAFLEQNINKEWFDDFVYIAKQPLEDRGYEIVPFDGTDVEKTLLTKNIDPNEDIIIGSVDATISWFKEANIDVPKPLGYPEQIKGFLGREFIETTFGELGDKFPFFVKPSGQVKLFTGDVVEKDEHFNYIAQSAYNEEDSDKITLAEKRERLKDMPVFKSEIVDFTSEYRCFIMNGEIKGIQYYQGDFRYYPDPYIIQNMVDAYKDCPSAYTLDVGVVRTPSKDGKHIYHNTVLVEVNDMWAIGSYGFNGKDYALMCARRMKEIVRNNKK